MPGLGAGAIGQNAVGNFGDEARLSVDSAAGATSETTLGVEQTGDSLIAQSGETIAAFTDSQARIYRTEET